MDGIDTNCRLCYNRPCFFSNSTLISTNAIISSCTEYLSADVLQTLNSWSDISGMSTFCEKCHGSINQLSLFVDELHRIQYNISQLAVKINQDVATQRTIHQNKKIRPAKMFPPKSHDSNSNMPALAMRTITGQSTNLTEKKLAASGSEKINTEDKADPANDFDDQLDWSQSPAHSDKSLETEEGTILKSAEILTYMKNAESGFKCENCSRTFSRLTILKSHECSKDTYDCDICGFSFSGPSVLKLHVSRTHSGEKPFKCDICGRTFGFKHHLAGHIRMHTGEKPYGCSECDKKYSCQSELAKHKKKHKNIRFPCEVCGKTYADMKTLRTHLKTHVDSSDLKCDICHKTFARPIYLKRHKLSVHAADKSKSHCCENCGKSFRSSDGLKYHMLVHTSDQTVKCEVCSKVFSCEQYLKVHHSQVHPKLETVICDVCGKNCTSQHQYKMHMKCHRGYIFDCQTCGKKYKSSQQLAYHISIIHKEEKPYKCDLCEESYKYRVGLKRHKLKKHLAVIDKNKFFTCQVCNEPFHSNSRMVNHQLQLHHVTSEEFVKCQNCSHKFADLGMYEWHNVKKPFMTKHLRCKTCGTENDNFANFCEYFSHLKDVHNELEPERYKCRHCGLIMPLFQIKTHPCDLRDEDESENELILESRRKRRKKKATKTSKALMGIRRSPRNIKNVKNPKIKKESESVAESDEDSRDYKKAHNDSREDGNEDFLIKSEIESSCDSDEMEVKTEVQYN